MTDKHTYFWNTERETKSPRAVVLFCHGAHDQSSRPCYKEFAGRLSENGYIFYAMDLNGHGQSSGARGHCPNFEVFSQTIQDYIRQIHALHPQLPLFLIGHSMGGLLAIENSLRLCGIPPTAPETLKGRVLANFMSKERTVAFIIGLLFFFISIFFIESKLLQLISFGIILFWFINTQKYPTVIPQDYHSKAKEFNFAGSVFISPCAGIHQSALIKVLLHLVSPLVSSIGIGFLSQEGLSRSEANRVSYSSDPLINLSPMQGGLLQGMLCGSEDILFRAHKFSNPFLLLVGEDDPICDPKSGKAFYESTSTKDDAKSFVSYKGLRHELLGEEEAPQIVSTIIEWLNKTTTEFQEKNKLN